MHSLEGKLHQNVVMTHTSHNHHNQLGNGSEIM